MNTHQTETKRKETKAYDKVVYSLSHTHTHVIIRIAGTRKGFNNLGSQPNVLAVERGSINETVDESKSIFSLIVRDHVTSVGNFNKGQTRGSFVVTSRLSSNSPLTKRDSVPCGLTTPAHAFQNLKSTTTNCF